MTECGGLDAPILGRGLSSAMVLMVVRIRDRAFSDLSLADAHSRELGVLRRGGSVRSARSNHRLSLVPVPRGKCCHRISSWICR
jgi:hypothetical protein